MSEHFIFLFYILLFIFSTIGYGEIFSKTVNKSLINYNIGYKGLIGFFFISLISLISSYFFSHNFIHNIVLHFVGIFGFISFLIKKKNNQIETKYFILLLLILLIGSYLYKNHDDFAYYHLTYSLNLSENKFIIGTGIFSHGFRTFSSIFYYNSILYMPLINFYLFHIGPFFILVFFNYIIFEKLFKSYKIDEINFLYYFKILIIVFVNVTFYRIGEHGTDRSAQILLLLIFLIFFELLFFKKDKNEMSSKLNLLLIIIFMASAMKAIYYIYLILIPIVLIQKKYISKFFIPKNFSIIFVLLLSISINLITNYFNTGCFLYPASKTCVGENSWSIPKDKVKQMKIHYEWWAKAGGGPNYKSEINPEKYVKDFNWLNNWIDRHFFNKVSDTLIGIVFLCMVLFLTFKVLSKNKKKQKFNYINLIIALLIPLIFLLEWFLNHPAMRYGGYVLLGLPFFIVTSFVLQTFDIEKRKIYITTVAFISISLLLFFGRNITRLNKEINFYGYDIFKSPYFYVEDVKSVKIFDNNDFQVYTTTDNKMCWASKTPCSYFKKIKNEKFLGLNVVIGDNR